MQHFAIIYTRDAVIPLSDDDREMAHSWKCVPVPPDASGNWIVVDDKPDAKTGWCEVRCGRPDVLAECRRAGGEPEEHRELSRSAIAAPVKKKRRRRKAPNGQLDFWRRKP
jgi:hypothetical protein